MVLERQATRNCIFVARPWRPGYSHVRLSLNRSRGSRPARAFRLEDTMTKPRRYYDRAGISWGDLVVYGIIAIAIMFLVGHVLLAIGDGVLP